MSEGIYPFGYEQHKMLVPQCGYFEKRWGGGGFTKSGLPDLHIVVNGYSIELELKAPKGRATELQEYNITLCRNSGGYAGVVKPSDLELIKRLVLKLKQEEPIRNKIVSEIL